MNNLYAKFEYKGMKTVGFTDYIEAFWMPPKMSKYSLNMHKIVHIFNVRTVIIQSLNTDIGINLLKSHITQTRHPSIVVDRQTDGQTDGRIETEWTYYCDLRFAKVMQIIYKLLWPENATIKEHKPTYDNALSDVEHTCIRGIILMMINVFMVSN